MARYWFKIAKFSYPLSFRALDWGDPYGIFGKALQILKLESLGQPMMETAVRAVARKNKLLLYKGAQMKCQGIVTVSCFF